MKVTVVCMAGLRDVTMRRWNYVWRKFGQFYDKPAKIPPALIQKGVDVVDMKEYMLQPKHELWSPPVPDDPRWAEPVPPENRPDWKADPAFSFTENTQLYEGVKQACLIAKAQHFEGTPASVERLMGAVEIPNRDLLLQRYIMLSQQWNTDTDKLPIRKPHPDRPLFVYKREFGVLPEKASLILMKNLLRLCQTQRADFPSLSRRKHIAEPVLDSYVMYRDKPIVRKEQLTYLLTSDTWLPPFGDEDLVDESATHKLPDMWPVYPTVDFTETNNYELNSYPGFTKENKFWCPHTILQIPSHGYWKDEHYQASQILTSLLLTAAMARRRFGDDVLHLPEPISVQHILVNESRLFFTYFQLNTLDLSSDIGVKNLVWTGQPTQFFEKVWSLPWLEGPEYKENRLEGYKGDAFEPFLASYLNGVPELLGR